MKFLHFVTCEKIIAVVDGFVANADSWYEVLKVIRSAFNENIGRVKQIGVDVAREDFFCRRRR